MTVIQEEGNLAAVRRYRARHPDRVRDLQVRRRSRANELSRLRRADREQWGKEALPKIRFRAKQLGLVCTITASDIPVPEHCPVLGIRLSACRGVGSRKSWSSPSVDRIDNEKGYVPENVRVISLRANMLKSDASVDEIRRILAYMEGLL